MLDESAEAPGIEQLVNGAVSTVAQTPAAAFPLSDMLVSLCTQESSKNKQQVFESLVQHLRGFGPAAVSSHHLTTRLYLNSYIRRTQESWSAT